MGYNTPDFIREHKDEIETKISYRFKNNSKLLIQAFTRKSFSQEHEQSADNEILEFYGDQLVNTVMTKWLFDSFSSVSSNNGFFHSEKKESELTKIRANYVNKSSLAHCIELLDLYKYLLLGKSDEKNEVWQNEKVRCDLFEAIIGAIAVDSKWDFKKIEESCKKMWGMLDFSENFIENLYCLCDDLGITKPDFSISRNSNENSKLFRCIFSFDFQNLKIKGFGDSEMSAKMNAAKEALKVLNRYQIEKILKDVMEENALQLLNTLYLKRFISKPEFNFSVSNDNDGNQIWRCECFIKEYEHAGIGVESTKTRAKQLAAYDMIDFILGRKTQKKATSWICPECNSVNSFEDSVCKVCNEGTYLY